VDDDMPASLAEGARDRRADPPGATGNKNCWPHGLSQAQSTASRNPIASLALRLSAFLAYPLRHED
jgi:hypothetical protein